MTAGLMAAMPERGRRVVADQTATLRRAAVLDGDGRLIDLYLDRLDRPTLTGAVFRARVDQILKDRNAVFVGLGDGRRGMLAAADLRPVPPKDGGVGTALRAGQTIIVQVKTDPQGDKAAVVSMDVSLTGRCLVYLPLGRGVLASKRLGLTPEARKALRAAFAAWLPTDGGWIIRGGGAGAPRDLLAAEAAALQEQWRAIAAAASVGGGGPALLRPPPDAAARALDDYGDALPAPAGGDGSAGFDFDAALTALARPQAPLEGGGELVIETTAALTAIDVNAAARGNPLTVNLAAAAETARQLRLRNIGGAVLVDFINMKNRGDQERVQARLTQATADDPAQTDIYGFTRLGLLEMSRARRGAGLAELLADRPARATQGGK